MTLDPLPASPDSNDQSRNRSAPLELSNAVFRQRLQPTLCPRQLLISDHQYNTKPWAGAAARRATRTSLGPVAHAHACVVLSAAGAGSFEGSRTTTTVLVAWRTSFSLTDPSVRPRKPPRPRAPTTSKSACTEVSSNRCAGLPCTAWHETLTVGKSRRSGATSASNALRVASAKSASGGT